MYFTPNIVCSNIRAWVIEARGGIMFFIYVIFTSISGPLDNLQAHSQMMSASFRAENPEELERFITGQIQAWSLELYKQEGKHFLPSSPAIVKLL